MYYIDEENGIHITRGDSAFIKLNLQNELGEKYIPSDTERVRCQVRNTKNRGKLIFEGTIEKDNAGDLFWHIYPNDTNGIQVKSYVYDMQLETADGEIFTFIPPSTFQLLDEVTLNE